MPNGSTRAGMRPSAFDVCVVVLVVIRVLDLVAWWGMGVVVVVVVVGIHVVTILLVLYYTLSVDKHCQSTVRVR